MDLNKKYERFIWRISTSPYDYGVLLKEDITLREVVNFINKHIEDKKFLIDVCLEKGKRVDYRHKLMSIFNYYNPVWIAKDCTWICQLEYIFRDITDIEENNKLEDLILPEIIKWNLDRNNNPFPNKELTDLFIYFPQFFTRKPKLRDSLYKEIIKEAKTEEYYEPLYNLYKHKNHLDINWKEIKTLAEKYVKPPTYHSDDEYDDAISSYHRGL